MMMNKANSTNKEIEINKDFEKIIDSVKKHKNVLLTGKAGTGKSTLLNYLIQNEIVQNVAVLAPTGIAAINVRGMTVHRFFSFPINVTIEMVSSSNYCPKYGKVIKNLETLIIDEISMLRADILDCLDLSLRKYGPRSNKPFGGVQMIFVGDLLQLPPVAKGEEENYLQHQYGTPYFFSSNAFKTIPFELHELSKIYRQKDQKFINVLNAIRTNTANESNLDYLNYRIDEKFTPRIEDFFITLTTTNAKADAINKVNLDSLDHPLEISEAKIGGTVQNDEYPTSQVLNFKKETQIMTLNNDAGERWVNGSIGTIEEVNLLDSKPYILIKLMHTGKTEIMHKFTWEIQRPLFVDNKLKFETVGTFSQFPFRLAWAITIHKSQGKTFQNVILDLKPGIFAEGQLYVALSRCTSIEGLVLKSKITKNQIMVDERVVEFLQNY